MVSKRSRLMALLLSVMMLLGTMIVATASASAASGDTVYCENAAGWGTVYCYMWGDGIGENQAWPGVAMTKGDGNLWSYKITGDWDNIIFNGGQNQPQTDDMTYPANGNCYNNSTKGWSTVEGGDTPTPTTPTTSVTPTPTPTPSDKMTVYCRNTANWSKISVYMWNSDSDKNAAWPGQTATNIGDGVWALEYDKNYKNIIFNDGGSTQTGDLTHEGTGMLYDNSTGKWEMYDTSKLHIKSFTADVASPQYTGVKINLSVVAGGGEGELSYQFSVGSTVISEYSTNSAVSWTPTTAGTFTVKAEVKDTAGTTVSKSMTYEIKDISAEVKPVIQSVEVTPTNYANNELLKSKEATVDITAGGGNTGTKLLFYKVTITDPSGETANVPYYTLKNEYKFTPATLGTYSVTATVQGSDNSFTARTSEYECVTEFSEPGDLTVNISTKEAGDGKYTATAEAFGGTAPYTYQFSVNGEIKQAYSDKTTCTVDASTPGSYTVQVTVKDAEGKTVSKSTTIQVSGGSDQQPTTPPVDQPEKLSVTLAVEDLGDNNYKFTANATGGEGSYQYQFSANGAVVKDYSDSNAVTLKMADDGTYTVKVTVKNATADAAATTASAEKTITISGGTVIMPLETTLTITEKDGNLIAKAEATGGEGEYQYQFSIDGDVYQDYSTADTFTFVVSKDYDYTYKITVDVKDAKTTVTASEAIKVLDGEIYIGAAIDDEGPSDDIPTTPGTSEPAGDYLKGDSDCNGKVNIKDATLIQKYVAKLTDMSAQGKTNAEVDGNGAINIKDATMIQKFIASLIEW